MVHPNNKQNLFVGLFGAGAFAFMDHFITGYSIVRKIWRDGNWSNPVAFINKRLYHFRRNRVICRFGVHQRLPL